MDTAQPPSFGVLLRQFRRRAGLTQVALAARSGITESAISALERGARERPYPDTLDRLATTLGLSVAERDALARAMSAADGDPVVTARTRPNATVEHTAPTSPQVRDAGRGLPAALTSFLGRERELAVATGLMAAGPRLLTLSGPGGAGKTQLAIESARAVAHNFPDGVWFVDLAPLPPGHEVAGTVAAALGVRDVPGRDVEAGILATLAGQRALLVLDNCEHVLDACAALVARLMQAGPGLTMLTTSREPLQLAGEQVYRVPPLGLRPEDDTAAAADPEALTRFVAIRLFVERARAVLPGFALTAEQAPATVEICRRLGGLPLAIELAAARIRTLTPVELAGRLTDRFRVVAGHARDRLPRHQTLRALIDWSHDLLAPAEQVLLRRLAVFAGGWDLMAAEAVCGDGSEQRAVSNEQRATSNEQRATSNEETEPLPVARCSRRCARPAGGADRQVPGGGGGTRGEGPLPAVGEHPRVRRRTADGEW
jgi:predicted ATPase/transcriptional regulator with XRE-family HTH domain